MRYLFNLSSFIILHLAFIASISAQNLVPNPSFENYNACPTAYSIPGNGSPAYSPTYTFFPKVTDWINPLYYSTSDYLNTCGIFPVSIPNGGGGYQTARTGNAMAGFFCIGGSKYLGYREYVEARLNQPLIAGRIYYVSFFLNLAGAGMLGASSGNVVATDQMGAYLTPAIISHPTDIVLTAPMQLTSPPGEYINDTVGWKKIHTIYTAAGNELFITIGKRFDGNPANIQDLIIADPQDTFRYVYNFLDDVCVFDILATTPLSITDTTLCVGSFPQLIQGQSTGDDFVWSTGDTSAAITITAPGTYWRWAFGACDYRVDTINIYNTSYETHDTTLCITLPATIGSPIAGATYNWNTGDTGPSIVVNTQGTYWRNATVNCHALSDTFHISDNTTAVNDSVICTNIFPFTLTATGAGLSRLWSTGDTTLTITANDTGHFYCITTLTCGVIIDSFYLRPPSPILDLGPDDTTYCAHTVVHIAANHIYDTYNWNTGSQAPDITVSQYGIYTLMVTDECGPQSDAVNISYFPEVVAPVGMDTTICRNSGSSIFATDSSLLWYTSMSDSIGTMLPPLVQTTDTGILTFYVSHVVDLCESVRSPVLVHIIDKPLFDLGPDTLICSGQTVTFGSDNNYDKYSWSNGQQQCCITVGSSGIYMLKAENVCGMITDSVTLEVVDCDRCLHIFSAFTPNHDGKNDGFHAISSCPVSFYRMKILNRWGEVVFQSEDIDLQWDGTYKAKPADVGVYHYMIEYQPLLPGAKKELYKGNLTLLR